MDVLLQHLLRDSAARAPDATCLRFAGGEQSYAELESESDQLARLLVRTKLRTGDRVGIYLPKSPRVVASMMATLKAGGVYVPIDPLAPPARAEMIARDAGVSHLFLNPERLSGWLEECALPESIRHLIVTGESLPALGASLPPMTRYDEYCGLPREPLPRAGRSEHDLAYILYTSGSTGRPKGVMLSHRNALAFVDWACTEFGLRATDRLSNHAPFHFDLTVFDLYAALRVGASCTIIDEVTARSARQLLGLIVDSELSVWYSVPSALRLLLDHSEFEADPPQSLRRILFAGEEFPLPQLRRLIRAIPAARYYNLYGPTETNVCTYYEVAGLEPERAALPIGTACSGAQVFVRDEQRREVGAGEIGELFVQGPTVMAGYWPVARDSGVEYATGDRVSWDASRQLCYHGRRDFMVKVRGYRVEIHDVEFALAEHPLVAETVVTACDDGDSGKVLVAHVVARDASLSVLGLKTHCSRRLPSYMVPQRVQLLAELPITSTGKVDRQKLQQDYERSLLNQRAFTQKHQSDQA